MGVNEWTIERMLVGVENFPPPIREFDTDEHDVALLYLGSG